MSFPKFSFVVPVLNGERTISQCLNSILNQSFTSYEVIVIDNGSTDSTAKIIQRFPQVQYFFEAKKGRSIARNRGIGIASGEFVAFVDCDVVLDRDWLLNMNLQLERFPLDVLASQVIPSRAPKSLLNNFRFVLRRWESNGSFLNINIEKGTNPTFNTAAGVVSRKTLLRLGGFNEAYKRCEDSEIAIRLFFNSYIFGGTTKARARVYYDFFPRAILPLLYLFRIFANSFYKPENIPSFSWKLPGQYELAKKLFLKKKFTLATYTFLYVLAMFFGRNLSSFFKKKYPRLPLASGHHELLGQFFWNSKTYGLRKGTRFFILNEHMYFMDDIRLKYVQISLPVRNALFRVFRQEKLSTEDVRLLEETNFFYSL